MKNIQLETLEQNTKLIQKTNARLSQLESHWRSSSLVAKVNNQDIDSKFFHSLDLAQKQFESLRSDFISRLTLIIHENIYTTLSLRSQAMIDLLFRNLFERTADVAFLATDSAIVNMCQSQYCDDFTALLQTYCKLYSVYKNVFVFDETLSLRSSAYEPMQIEINNRYLTKALTQDDYQEWLDTSMTDPHMLSIYYAKAVKNEQDKTIGCLVLEFGLKEELEAINQFLTTDSQQLKLGLSNHDQTLWGETTTDYREGLHIQHSIATYSSTFKGFQGYLGLPWQAQASIQLDQALNTSNYPRNFSSPLFPTQLYQIQEKSDSSLTNVILNGTVTSMKQGTKAFLPILDDFQRIASGINEILLYTIDQIYGFNLSRVKTETKFSAELIAEFFSRSFYERANDCRWWTYNQNLCNAVQFNKVSTATEILTEIHQLYTVYQDITIYHLDGSVLCQSENSSNVCYMPDEMLLKTLKNLPIGSYYAALHADAKDNRTSNFTFFTPIMTPAQVTIAILGITFDTKNQLSSMLQDALPKKENKNQQQAWGLLFANNKIIAQTNNVPSSFITLYHNNRIDLNLLTQEDKQESTMVIDQQNYLISAHHCRSYREFLVQTGFSHVVTALVGQQI